MECDKAGVTLGNMEIKSGWYRFSDRADELYRCPYPGHCIGNSTCSASSEGALCSSCRKGFYLSSDKDHCVKCGSYAPGPTDIFVFIVFGIILALFCFVTFVKLCTCKSDEDVGDSLAEDTQPDDPRPRKKSTQDKDIQQAEKILRLERKLKLFYAYFQLVSGFTFNLAMTFPEPFQGVVNALGFLNIDIFASIPLACSFTTNYLTSLLATMLTPLGFALCFLGIHEYQARRSNLEHRNDFFFQAFLLTLYIVLPSTSSKCFASFRCDPYEVGDGDVEYYLAVDHSINCSSAQYRSLFATALLFILIYPIGVPLLYGVLLWRDRKDLMDPAIAKVLEKHKKIKRMSHHHLVATKEGRNEALFFMTFFFSAATRGKFCEKNLKLVHR